MFAEAGVLGAAFPIEGPFGFLHAYSGDYDTSKLTTRLGIDWSFLKTALKPCPLSNDGWLVYDYLHDEKVKRISDKIKVEVADVPNSTATTLVVTWANGSSTEASVVRLLWEEERLVAWTGLENKFKGLAPDLIGHEMIDRIVERTKNMSGHTIEDLMIQARL